MIISAGVVIVRKEGRSWKVLLLRAYRNWDFPKGEPEPGEDLWDTARREVAEETGITDLAFTWDRSYQETEPYRDGKKIARYYLAETQETEVVFSVNPEIGKPEHQEYRWMDLVRAREIVPDRLKPVVDWARRTLEGG